ncbi:MAG TPA: three-Cys-motif partner protein TcmP [Thermoanaerobaculia bacterium]|nr:three-Cys-motif partner protein TcmP [Thermoanaerobaculia bacterium]
MTKRKEGAEPLEHHRFGGDWTTTKLEILKHYLRGYTTALKKTPFKTAYIDAFAGTGYRTLRQKDFGESPLYPDLIEAAPQALLDGSARMALQVEPPFNRYIFVEKSHEHCDQLLQLKEEFPELAKDIRIEEAEANEYIQKLCGKKGWGKHRAVLFLDPYGMQVEWETIEAVARTKAIDLWVLFPLGIGVNRLLTRSGDIPESWKRRLDLLLGTQDWYDEFYKVQSTPTLFGPQETPVKESLETIGRFFNERLKTIFAGVAPTPKVLRNSANCPLYLFCFAVGNKAGAPIALEIANHLLRKID